MTVSPLKTLRLIASAGVLVALVGSTGTAQGPIPGLGTWTLNVANSKQSPAPPRRAGPSPSPLSARP